MRHDYRIDRAADRLRESLSCFPDGPVGCGMTAIKIAAGKSLVQLALKDLEESLALRTGVNVRPAARSGK